MANQIVELAQLADFARRLSISIQSGEVPLENTTVANYLEAFAGALESSRGRYLNRGVDPDTVSMLQKVSDALDAATVYD